MDELVRGIKPIYIGHNCYSNMKENTVFSGKIGEVVHMVQDDGRIFEQYRRSPGTRLIIISPENKILITREYRFETNSFDLRLPGGKVCDTLVQYVHLRQSTGDVLEAAKQSAIKEAVEETGLIIKDPQFLVKANAGTTVEWDLYYFIIRDYQKNEKGQRLEKGENITVTWLSTKEIFDAIQMQKMQEWRSVGVLLGLVMPLLTNGPIL